MNNISDDINKAMTQSMEPLHEALRPLRYLAHNGPQNSHYYDISRTVGDGVTAAIRPIKYIVHQEITKAGR